MERRESIHACALNWRRSVLLVGFWAGGAGLFLLLRAVTQPLGSGDASIYQAMAEHPTQFAHAPHGYRILVPWLVHGVMRLTALPVTSSYLAVSAILFASLLAVLALWFHCIEHADALLTLQVVLLGACAYPGLYYSHNVMHVGLGELVVLTAGCAAIRARHFGLVLGIVIAGGFVKETALALVPLWFIVELGSMPWRRLLPRAASLAVAGLAVFFVLRSGLLFAAAGAPGSGAALTTTNPDELRAYWVSPYNVVMRVSETFGALWLLAALGFVYAEGRARRLALLIPLALGQIAVATDISRMAALALPVVLLLALMFLRRLPRIGQVVLTVFAIAVFVAYDFRSPMTRWLLVVAYLAIAGAQVWLRFSRCEAVCEKGMRV